MEENRVYEQLAEHLNRLPAGFPRTPTGVEIRILKRLFTPEEARYACTLTLKPEPPEEIAKRLNLEPGKVAGILEEMAKKGLIFRIRKGSETRYMAAQFIIGIWEYHVNQLTPELIADLREYAPYFFQQAMNLRTPQLRVIPIPGSVTAVQSIMPYEEARRLVEENQPIVVAPCICRKEHGLTGEACDRPLESCLVFGLGAQYYMENGLGRQITVQEALKILEEAERDGRVLQPSNAQKITNICTCCGCCCQILKNLKKLDKPALYVVSRHIAELDEESCVLCGTCVDRCQMDAITLGDDHAVINRDRCIGCGLCVTTCPEEAITLKEKPKELQKDVPASLRETYARMFQERMSAMVGKA
ncbi:4Fe-4S binding protein [Thermodesulforhabdus norvegica]|uniref:4Fe-4S dicluster domain-containing protein n=1 Tax=Thermodesulforhabdus norvegica TaxID=39841 RepID=A0A1I4V0M5_9BACT|nr:4Fe-4S binding protein [Thermodesulforhabdus norvegica]SFM94711.1 4Fe-4S dicluster domain-containing protein [Thermodesulforhabdus norvegica]